MKHSLRNRLTMSYIIIAMICVLLISVIASVSLESLFRAYVKGNQEKKNQNIVDLISQQYQGDKGWNKEFVQDIGVNALEGGMIVSVTDADGSVVWDATQYNNGMCEEMMSHITINMSSRYPNWKGIFTTADYAVMSGDTKVGSVRVGYYGPFYFNEVDLAFINTVNTISAGVGLVALLLALMFGYIMAKSISTPISRVINTAQMISKGCYNDRSNEISDIKEIAQLNGTINDLAENLEKQEKLRKRLTADVAHELRTPLATLQSHVEAMIDGIWAPDANRLKSVHEEIMRLERLVGDMEKLTRFEGENMVLNKSEFDAVQLIRGIMDNSEREYSDRGIIAELSGEPTEIFADRDKLSQVIINLITNAVKFTDRGGSIRVSVTGSHENVNIAVADTGKGIAPEHLPFIFERFYRADASRSRLTGGAGIGLTIVKTIVEAHKGTIKVDSELGKGTRFEVTLPRR
ncbi:MAG TPA: HAMP domain-containing sensor histidine kinase [Negativicutes bacterium]|nr:HAMP domain-containing sensor histidine kinase [Negativicutes bacterium]